MSNHLISEVYKRQVGSMARKAVLALFADKASDDGTGIWASKQRMAEEIGTTKQTVITTIKALIDDGLLVQTGQRKSPNGYTVEYAIQVQALRTLPLVPSHREDQSSRMTGQEALPVKQLNPTGKAARPKPSETPHSRDREARAHELPLDWKPGPFGLCTKSRKIVDGWPPGEFEHQLEHFTAHHRKKGDKFKDWQAAWSTWVLGGKRFNGSRNNIRNGSEQRPDRSQQHSLEPATTESLTSTRSLEIEHKRAFLETMKRWDRLFKRKDGDAESDKWLMAEYFRSLGHLSPAGMDELTEELKARCTFFPSIRECLEIIDPPRYSYGSRFYNAPRMFLPRADLARLGNPGTRAISYGGGDGAR